MFADNRKPVTVNGVHYDSINEAARALDMCPVTLSRWLKRGRSVKRHLGAVGLAAGAGLRPGQGVLERA